VNWQLLGSDLGTSLLFPRAKQNTHKGQACELEFETCRLSFKLAVGFEGDVEVCAYVGWRVGAPL